MSSTTAPERVGAAAPMALPKRAPNRGILAGSPTTAYLFLLPYFILFATFVLAPVVYGLWISLHAWDFLLPGKPWVGLENYTALFDPGSTVFDPFWMAMRATGFFTLLSVPLLIVIPLGLAVALNSKFRGKNFFRAVFFMPYVLGVAVIGLLWRYLLDPNVGVVNFFLGQIGIDGPAWTTGTPWVWVALVVPTLWWTMGYNTIIFLAGLQDISQETYEAAEVDGANKWQQFKDVTIPGLRPVLVFVVTITLLASANVFGQPYLITDGQPGERTRSAIMLIGETGLRQFNMGSASAMSTILALALMLVSLLNFVVMRERKGR